MDLSSSAMPEPSLITYPCDFPIKVMGANVPEFLPAMLHVVRQFDPTFDPETVERRLSKAANFLGLTFTVHVGSREQLDELYRTLSTHPLVKMAL